jgi:hypothetical protein
MLGTGLLSDPLTDASIARWEGRPVLELEAGELTVLRTDVKAPSQLKYRQDPRRWQGFDVRMNNRDLKAASLRWWRCAPPRVLDNKLFVVTIAEFPVALYLLREPADGGLVASQRFGRENFDRHHFEGDLVARLDANLAVFYEEGLPPWLTKLAPVVMSARIRATSGGPIGYLEPE